MKILVTVVDDNGRTFEGELLLHQAVPLGHVRKGKRRASPGRPVVLPIASQDFDFDLPIRAFVKRYGAKLRGGHKRFTLLLARLTAGDVGKPIYLGELSKAWNKMTEHLGGRFNPAYPTRASDNGWVNSPKRGTYALRSTWQEILNR